MDRAMVFIASTASVFNNENVKSYLDLSCIIVSGAALTSHNISFKAQRTVKSQLRAKMLAGAEEQPVKLSQCVSLLQ